MLDFWGNRKIGIVGLANSGKTMFLTSLLCHLEKHDPEQFSLGTGVQIMNFQIIVRKDHDFNFAKHRNTLIQRHCWPAKTMDYAIAECRYEQSGKICDRHLKFVDIPGERFADIEIWNAKDYHAWVKSLWKFWENNPDIEKEFMKSYMDLANNPDSSLADLIIKYKSALWDLMEHCCPITPSTYFLGIDGSMIQFAPAQKETVKNETIENRHIWNDDDLLPLPESWCKSHPVEYKQQIRLFHEYKKKVLKPLFREIDDCDHFILCVNIPRIFDIGPERKVYEQWLFENFLDGIKPSKLIRWRDKVCLNPPRLAFVATQSDRDSSKTSNNLQHLLEKFVIGTKNIDGVTRKFYTCSACNSFLEIPNEDGTDSKYIGYKLKRDENGKKIKIEKKDYPAIPEEWPMVKDGKWDPDLNSFLELEPVIIEEKPRQIGINTIFEFIVG